MARNLCEGFTRRAAKRAGQIAIQWKRNDRWVDISYDELQNNITALSLALYGYYGIAEGDKVAILLGNRPEWPTAFFALLYANAIPVPVNAQGTSEETEHILAAAGCRAALTEDGSPHVGIKAISVDSDDFKHALSLFPSGTCSAKAARDDLACIMYTSGTTASPKGVMLSHGNLLSNIYSLYKLGLMKKGDGVVAALPLHHNYAMTITTLAPLIHGGRVIFPGSIRSKEVMLAIRQSRPALFIGVPMIFEMFHETIMNSLNKQPAVFRLLIDAIAEFSFIMRKRTGINIGKYFFYNIHRSLGRSMRAYLSGGARLNENVEKDLFKFGFTVLNGYGLTETSPVLTVNPIKKPKIGSVGLPIANVEIKITDKDENGIGEILAAGPNIMKGYYKNEDLTRTVIEEGWFKTKDIGYIDKDGYLFIVGRMDNAITLKNGLTIYPDEIEEAYLSGTNIKEICVFDVPSPKGVNNNPVIWAVAVPDMDFFNTKGITNPYNAIKAAFEKVSKELNISSRLMGFSLTLDKLPQTLMGKIIRREVKKLYFAEKIKEAFRPEEKHISSTDLTMLQSSQADKIMDCLKTQTQVKEITPNDSFELDLGIDLIGRAELAYELEKRLGTKIDEKEMNNIFTVGELIAYVKKIRQEK